ncbi:class A beta-lactamase [Actinomadura litoris]|uniref:class A beta-lactamase n=1 Tax=Actinomadura litoris TaxID=2678616 RepID=UPI001FA7DA1D|nr:class A beta-lactamase [Actinomadura litoris]
MRTPPSRFRVRLAAGAAAVLLTGVTACGAGGGSTSAAPRSDTAPLAAPARPALSQGTVAERLNELERTHQARIGAWALDTGTGRVLTHRADERFPFLSTFKAVACGAVLRKARRSDPGLLDRVIRYTEDDLVPNSPVTEKHVATGMSVADLCHAAITVSDNTAGNLVLRQIGGPAGHTAFFRSLGDRVSRHDRWETDLNLWSPGERRDTVTPRAWGRDLRELTLGRALVPADRARLVGWMKAAETGGARIRAGLPPGWIVGDKTGTGGTYGTANDIAIAYPPSGGAPLIIVITTNRRASGGSADEKAIAETAAILAQGLGARPVSRPA